MRSTKRDEIVAAATELIRSDGVRAASIAKIADHVGIAKSVAQKIQ